MLFYTNGKTVDTKMTKKAAHIRKNSSTLQFFVTSKGFNWLHITKNW